MIKVYLTKKIVLYPLNDVYTLAINGVSGAVDILDQQTYQVIDNMSKEDNANIPDEIRIKLQERGYLFENHEEETNLIDRLYQFQRQFIASRPINFVICPTYGCNLRCTYCFLRRLHQNMEKNIRMNQEQIDATFKAIDTLKSLLGKKGSVQLFGGEPLLASNQRIVEEVLVKSRERDMKVSIVTNGVCVHLFKNILAENKDMIKYVQITLDGPQEIHDQRRIFKKGEGTFFKIIKAVDLLLEMEIRVNLRVNVDLENVEASPKLISLMEEKGWSINRNFGSVLAPVTDHLNMKDLSNIGQEQDLLVRIQRLFAGDTQYFKDFVSLRTFRVLNHIGNIIEPGGLFQQDVPMLQYCEANNLEFYVFGPDGFIYGCPESIGRTEFAIGEFYPDFKLDTEKTALWKDRSILTIPECKECNVAAFCGGGCAYSALNAFGTTRKPACINSEGTLRAYLDNARDRIVKNFCTEVTTGVGDDQ